MKVLVIPLHFYVDLKFWVAVKPIEPMGKMFFVSTSPTLLGQQNAITNSILQKLNVSTCDQVEIEAVEAKEFFKYLTEEEKGMTPNES